MTVFVNAFCYLKNSDQKIRLDKVKLGNKVIGALTESSYRIVVLIEVVSLNIWFRKLTMKLSFLYIFVVLLAGVTFVASLDVNIDFLNYRVDIIDNCSHFVRFNLLKSNFNFFKFRLRNTPMNWNFLTYF